MQSHHLWPPSGNTDLSAVIFLGPKEAIRLYQFDQPQ